MLVLVSHLWQPASSLVRFHERSHPVVEMDVLERLPDRLRGVTRARGCHQNVGAVDCQAFTADAAGAQH